MTAPVILVEAQPRNPATGVAVTVRFAGGGDLVPYRYAGEHWQAGIAEFPKIVTSLDFDGEQLGGGGVPQAMELRWAPATSAALADAASLFWADAPVTVRIGPEGAVPPPIATAGLVLDAASDGGVLRIALADKAVDLKRPFLVDRFAGTGGIEGPIEWEGQIKPRVLGACFNVPGKLIDEGAGIWSFGDPRRPIDRYNAVRDRGAPASAGDLTVLAWQGSAEATFAALRVTAAPQGGGVLCPSINCIRWWTIGDVQLHVDLRGETDGGYVETAPEIAARIVAARSTLQFAPGAIAAAAAARPMRFGWRVDNDSATAAAEISELLAGVSLSWVIADDQIVFRRWEWLAPVRQARSLKVKRLQVFKPVTARKLGYRRNWAPMARGDLRAVVLLTDNAYEDGTTLEALKPATPGATAGAPAGTPIGGVIQPDGTIVGGTPAEDVLAAIAAAQARQDDLDTVIIPSINDAVSDAGERIDAARQDASEAIAAANLKLDQTSERLDGEDAAIRRRVDEVVTDFQGLDGATNVRIGQEVAALSEADLALGRRIDSVAAGGNYDDTAVYAEVRRVDEAAIGRDDAIARSVETVSARFVGGGGNLLSNTDFVTTDGWGVDSPYSPNGPMAVYAAVDIAGDLYHPAGEHVLAIEQLDATGGGAYSEWQSAKFAVTPGEWIQFYTFYNSHRADVGIHLIWFDEVANLIGAAEPARALTTGRSGINPANYVQIGLKSTQAPPTAVWARLLLRKYDTYPGQGSSYAWFWRPYVGAAREGQTGWNAYVAGSPRAVQTRSDAAITQAATAAANAGEAVAGLSTSVDTRFAGVDLTFGTYSDRINAISTAQSGYAGRTQVLEAAASVADRALNANPNFAMWSDPAAPPNAWGGWGDVGPYGRIQNTLSASGYMLEHSSAGINSGFVTTPVYLTVGWHVIEADVWKTAGSWAGAGATASGAYNLDFMSDPDVAEGVGDIDVSGGVRRWSKLIYVPVAGYFNWHLMTNWEGFGRGDNRKTLRWLRCAVRAASDLEIKAQKAITTTIPAVAARVQTTEDTLADLPNRYAAASRTTILEAQLRQEQPSALNDAVNYVNGRIDTSGQALAEVLSARIESRATAIADAKAGAVAQTVEQVRASLDGRVGQVEQQTGAIVGIDGRTSVYWEVIGTTPGGQTSLRLSKKDGSPADFYVGANMYVAGNVVVDGTIIARKFDRNSMSRVGTAVWTGSISPALGQTITVPWSLSLSQIPPLGRFIYEYTVTVDTNANQTTATTLNGRPAYTTYLEDAGGLIVVAYDQQGNAYTPRPNSSATVLATTDFVPAWTAIVRRGNRDTGYYLDGDYYTREVSASYTVTKIDLKVTWVAI